VESDIFGTNSTCNTWSAGKNTGASRADWKLPDRAAEVKFIGLKVLVDLGGGEEGTDTPVEKRGRSDDLKLEKRKEGGGRRVWLRMAVKSTIEIRTQI
jgi:hypothetical protein